MRHNVDKHTFGRKHGPRVALLRGLVTSLVKHGRIKTTVPKAKELRRHVERAITMGKKGTLHARRSLLSDFPNQDTVKTIVDDLSVRFKTRPGGYTRIIKIGARPGDKAEMAYIQFVDFKAEAPAAEGAAKTDALAKSAKAAAVKVKKAKKTARKAQTIARRVNRKAK